MPAFTLQTTRSGDVAIPLEGGGVLQATLAAAGATTSVQPASLQGTIFLDPLGTNGQVVPSDTSPPTATFPATALTPGGTGPVFASWAGVLAALGTFTPRYAGVGKGIQVQLLSSQPAGQDGIFFGPLLSDGAQAVLLGVPVLLTDIPVCGTVTAKARGGPGTLLQVAAMPGSAASRVMALNLTRGSIAFIDSVAGAVATMSQPVPLSTLTTVGIPTNTEDNTWATGDHLQLFTLPAVNLKQWRPQGADVGAAGNTQACVGWVQFVRIADTSGTGASEYPHISDSAAVVLSACQVDTRLNLNSLHGRVGQTYVLGCDVNRGVLWLGAQPEIFAGILRNGLTAEAGIVTIDGDCIIHGAVHLNFANGSLGAVFGDGNWDVDGGNIQMHVVEIGVVALWGSFNLTLFPGSTWWNVSGGTFAASLLTSGALKFGTSTTGTKYVAGAFTDGVAITQANLDTNNGLQYPLTGARFCNPQ